MKSLVLFSLAALLSSCSTKVHHSTTVRRPGSVDIDNDNVIKYINAMKLLGSDGRLVFYSAWHPEKKLTAQQLVDEVNGVVSNKAVGIDQNVISRVTNIETQDVCLKWKPYTANKVSESKSTMSSSSDSSFSLGFGLDVGAEVSGLFSGDGGFFGIGFGGGGEFGFGSSSSSYEHSESVKRVVVSKKLLCSKSARYQRAVTTITPDVMSLHPQAFASLIYTNINQGLEKNLATVRAYREVLERISIDPKISEVEAKSYLSKFSAVQLWSRDVVGKDEALTKLEKDFSSSLLDLQNAIGMISKNKTVANLFSDTLEEILAEYKELGGMAKSFEQQNVYLKIGDRTLNLLRRAQVMQLDGAPSSEIKNASYFKQEIEDNEVERLIASAWDERNVPYSYFLSNMKAYLYYVHDWEGRRSEIYPLKSIYVEKLVALGFYKKLEAFDDDGYALISKNSCMLSSFLDDVVACVKKNIANAKCDVELLCPPERYRTHMVRVLEKLK